MSRSENSSGSSAASWVSRTERVNHPCHKHWSCRVTSSAYIDLDRAFDIELTLEQQPFLRALNAQAQSISLKAPTCRRSPSIMRSHDKPQC